MTRAILPRLSIIIPGNEYAATGPLPPRNIDPRPSFEQWLPEVDGIELSRISWGKKFPSIT